MKYKTIIKNILKKFTQISLLISTALIASAKQAEASTSAIFQHKDYEHLIFGFYREVYTNNEVPIKDICGVIYLYYNNVHPWIVPKSTIVDKLDKDSTVIYGPEFCVKEYKFIFKAKRNKGRLYLGVYYQRDEVIQEAMHAYFESIYSRGIADKIIESFNAVTGEEEFDDVPLILHDMSDPTYSCLLEYIEGELRSSLLLIPYGNIDTTINDIKQNMIRIFTLYNPPDGPEVGSLVFYLVLKENETGKHFSKLYKFDTPQIEDKGAEMNWRNPYNDYKDYDIDFDNFIEDIEQLRVTAHIHIIDLEYDAQQADKYTKDECCIEELLDYHKISNMRDGEHIDPGHQRYLLYDPENEFGIRIYFRHGKHHIILFPKSINDRRRGADYMNFDIAEIIVRVDGIPCGKKENVTFSEKQEVCCVGGFVGFGVFTTNGDNPAEEHESKTLTVSLRGVT